MASNRRGDRVSGTERRLRCGPFEIGLRLDGRAFAGIGRIACGGRPLRNDRVPCLPVVETVCGHVFEAWQLASVERASNALAVHCRGTARPQWHTGSLNCYGEPNVRPLRAASNRPRASLALAFRADRWMGLPRLRVRTLFASPDAETDWIIERFTWEPGGSTQGATYFAPRWGAENGGWEHRLDRKESFSTRDAMTVNGRTRPLGSVQPRGGGGPAMDFVWGPRGALALFREDLTHVRGLVEKRAGETVLAVTDQCWHRRGRRLKTPWLSVVFHNGRLTREGAHDLWTRLWDRYADGLARRTAIPRPTPLPAIACECWNMGSGRFFEHQRKFLAAIAATGARRVLLHTLPHPHAGHNCCGLYELGLLATEGGLPALRRYTDAAHARGLEVIGWAPGHLHRDSPLLKRNPDWAVRNRLGHVFGGGYDCLAALDFAHPGVQRYYVDSMLALRRRGGLDGVWLDSLLNLHFYGISHSRTDRNGGVGDHVAGLLACLRRLAEAGLAICTEGVSPLGLSMGGIGFDGVTARGTYCLHYDRLNTGATGLYRTALWARGQSLAGGRGISRDLYFRCLANAAPVALFYDTSDHRLSPKPALPLRPPVAIPDYRRLNEVYVSALPHMQVRELLPGDAGVLWHPRDAAPADLSHGQRTLGPDRVPGPRVLFSFRSGTLALPGSGWAGLSCREMLTGGAPTTVCSNFVRVRRGGVYRLDGLDNGK